MCHVVGAAFALDYMVHPAKEVLGEIIALIDELDQLGAEGTPMYEASREALDSLMTDIYMLCEHAIGQ